MATEKGLIKDDDRFTKKHQEMCLWFTDDKNVKNFIRFFLLDIPFDIDLILEKPVVSSTGFLLGYADIVLSYNTDQSKNEKVLVEIKSSLSDYGATLRQIRTYQEYLGNITKTVLIYNDFKNDNEMEKACQFFISQKIYFVSLDGIVDRIECGYEEEGGTGKIPTGKRSAELCCISFHKNFWDFGFLVSYDDKLLDGNITDLIHSENYIDYKDFFFKILKQLDIDIDVDNPISIRPGDIAIDCFIELNGIVDEIGYSMSIITGIYIKDDYIEILPNKPKNGR